MTHSQSSKLMFCMGGKVKPRLDNDLLKVTQLYLFFLGGFFYFIIIIYIYFYFAILYWFCHTSTCIRHGYRKKNCKLTCYHSDFKCIILQYTLHILDYGIVFQSAWNIRKHSWCKVDSPLSQNDIWIFLKLGITFFSF